MDFLVNLTDLAAAHFISRGGDGQQRVVCVVKGTFAWREDGTAVPADTDPVRLDEEYSGEGVKAVIARAAELGPPKRRLDVLVEGELVFPAAVERIDTRLELGNRLRKTVRVFGDRTWLPVASLELVASRPRPVTRMPITWARSFGGLDPSDPSCIEARNPAGVGLRRKSADLRDTSLPNFEDPADPVQPGRRHHPVGLGAVAPHWSPRVQQAGTYDETWKAERYPLLPADFQETFHNVAPVDQQLDGYVPGEEVRLVNMTLAGRDQFLLPAFEVPITFATDEIVIETRSAVDTLIIEPGARRFSIVARATHLPLPSLLALRRIVVGKPTTGVKRALRTGKPYVRAPSPKPPEQDA